MEHLLCNILVMPLSGIIGNSFEALRESTASMGGTISTAALVLGCFFFGFKLLQMYYEIASDEQHGGFGGVRLWDIMRPVLILLLIAGYQQVVVRPVDALASMTANVVGGGKTSMSAGTKKLKGLVNDFKEAKEEARTKTAQVTAKGLEGSFGDGTGGSTSPLAGQGADQIASGGSRDGGEKTVSTSNGWHPIEKIKEWFSDTNETYRQLKIWRNGIIAGSVKGCGTLIDSLLTWWFNIMGNVIKIFADLMLPMLVMIGPLMFAFSIFDRWGGYTYTFIGQYIQLSLWKPIVGVIFWATSTTSSAIGAGIASQISGASTAVGQWLAVTVAAIGQTAIITLAGIMMLKQVPAIVNSLVSLANGLSAPVEAGSAVAGGMAGAAIGAAGRAAGGAAGLAGRAVGGGLGAAIGAPFGSARAGAAIGSSIGSAPGTALGKVGQSLGQSIGKILR